MRSCQKAKNRVIGFSLRLWVATFLALVIKDSSVLYGLVAKSYSPLGYLLAGPTLPSYAFIALMLLPSLLFKKSGKISLLLINLVASVMMFCMVSYFRAFNNLPSTLDLALLENIEPAEGTNQTNIDIFMLVKSYDFLLFADILVFAWVFRKKEWQTFLPRKWVWLAMLLSFIVLIFSSSSIKKNDLFKMGNQLWREQGLWGTFIDNEVALRSSKFKKLSFSDQLEMEKWFLNHQNQQVGGQLDGKFAGKNVIFLTIESLESFVVGAKLDGLEIAPNLNHLLSHSYVFPNIYHQTTATSVHGLFILQTGFYSPLLGVVTKRFPHNQYNQSIAHFFEGEGYSTLGSHGSNGETWEMRELTQQMGYQQVAFSGAELPIPTNASEQSLFGLADKAYFKAVSPLLQAQKQPAFSFLFTTSSHSPFTFDLGGTMDKPFSSTVYPVNLANYLNSLHYADQALGQFLQDLEEAGRLENTILVITGDHSGVSLYYPKDTTDLERLEYTPPYSFSYKKADIRSPLIIYNPNLNGQYFDIIGGQVDVYPTVASLFAQPKWPLVGQNLFTAKKGYALLPNGIFVGEVSSEEAKLIRQGRIITDRLIVYQSLTND